MSNESIDKLILDGLLEEEKDSVDKDTDQEGETGTADEKEETKDEPKEESLEDKMISKYKNNPDEQLKALVHGEIERDKIKSENEKLRKEIEDIKASSQKEEVKEEVKDAGDVIEGVLDKISDIEQIIFDSEEKKRQSSDEKEVEELSRFIRSARKEKERLRVSLQADIADAKLKYFEESNEARRSKEKSEVEEFVKVHNLSDTVDRESAREFFNDVVAAKTSGAFGDLSLAEIGKYVKGGYITSNKDRLSKLVNKGGKEGKDAPASVLSSNNRSQRKHEKDVGVDVKAIKELFPYTKDWSAEDVQAFLNKRRR